MCINGSGRQTAVALNGDYGCVGGSAAQAKPAIRMPLSQSSAQPRGELVQTHGTPLVAMLRVRK
jgi:hypothetical protein